MLNGLDKLVRLLSGAAIFTGLILLLAPERRSKGALKLLCGVLLCAVLLTGIRESNLEALAEEIAAQKLDAADILTAQEENAYQVYRAVIKSETEAYIWKQAQELGIQRLGVRLTLRDGEDAPYPWFIELCGSVTVEQQERLSMLLEGELGIPAERQQWSVSDVD